MYVISGKTARSAAAKLIIATAASATVCAYCAGLPTTPVVTTAAIVDTAAIVQSPTTIGIADSDLYGMSQADIDTTLDNLESIGVQNVRVFVPWAYVEPAQGTYDWSYLDDVVQAAAARNMGVLAVVNATPAWDAPANSLPGAGTPNPTDYASFLTQVATRYGNDISSYEVWNEPNYVASYDPIDPATYTALLKAAYPAIKAANPDATVIAGALGSTISLGDFTLDPVTFVKDMLADGASGYFDALSFHPYQETTEFSQGATLPNSPINQLNAIEQLLAANGLANDKVWLTEYGLSTADVSQQTQATYIKDLIDAWQSVSYAGPVFVYTAQDSPSTDPNDTFGIFGADWTPKLAATVIQQEIARLTAPVVPPTTTPTDPFAALGQQIAAALNQAAQSYAQTLNQQIADALAAAFAKAVAGFGANAAVATPAVATVTQTAAATTQTAAPTSTPAKVRPRLLKALAKLKATSTEAVSETPSATGELAATASTPTASSDDAHAVDHPAKAHATDHPAKAHDGVPPKAHDGVPPKAHPRKAHAA